MKQFKIIESYLPKINKELRNNPDGTSQLVSIKILYPCNTGQSALQPFLVLHKDIDERYYNQFEKKYITVDNDKIRSLAFQMYSDAIKLKNIDRQEDKIYSDEYQILKQEPIPTQGFNMGLLKVEQIENFWDSWADIIKSEFANGESTLWTYVVLRRDGKAVVGSAFLIFSKKIEHNVGVLINKYCQDLLIELITSHFYEELLNQATRAAISQVMARNTSHNIGAHVMNKLTGDLKEVKCRKFKNYQSEINLYDESSDDDKILLNQISIFNNYVKCRMDYLADISFGTPLMQTNKYTFGDLFKEFDKVRLLLEYLSGLSDNFKFKIQFCCNGKEMSDENDLLIAMPNDILGMQAFYNILENIIRNTAKHAKKPSDRETKYIVNFIDELERPTREQTNILNDFVAVEIYDDIPVDGDGRDLTEEEKAEYERLGLNAPDKFESEIERLVFSQNSKINANILEDNKLRSGSLGVIEMDASAAYLRKRDVSHINHDNYTLHYDDSWSCNSIASQKDCSRRGTDCRYFLKAFKKGSALGYRFFLLRPEIVLVVTEKKIEDNDAQNYDNLKQLKKEGIWVVSPEDFEKHLVEGRVYNHEFVIHIKSEETTNIEKKVINIAKLTEHYKTSLPLRILEISEDELKSRLFGQLKGLQNDKKHWKEIFEKFCWEKVEEKLKIRFPCKKGNQAAKHNCFSIKSCYNEFACYSVVLLDHLYSLEGKEIDKELVNSVWNEYSVRDCYLEALSSIAQSRMPEFNKLSLINNKSVTEKFKDYVYLLDGKNKRKILESSYSKIVVIDERIQEASKKEFMGIPYIELYSKINVFVPAIDQKYVIYNKPLVNLSKSTFDKITLYKLAKNIISYMNDLTMQDYILIHYSILERIYEDKTLINSRLEKLSKRTNVVITSGRGVPDNLTPKIRFVNLSSVIAAFVDIRSKYVINYLLSSSRKAKK